MSNISLTPFRHWLYVLFFVIAGLTLFWEEPSQAAPHKTVPRFTPQPTHTPTPVPMATSLPSIAQLSIDQPDQEAELNFLGLTLFASPVPQFVHQGEMVELQFEVVNGSNQTATEVILSDALPFGLELIEAKTDGIFRQEKGREGETIIQVFWSNILPSVSVSANVQLQIIDDMPDGVVIENLAALYSKEFPGETVGIQIGLPPSTLPYFD